jgi:dTDP-4-amino-4,6-dideoxygalactose transaminase
MQAAVLLAKLPHLDDWNARRASRAARYDSLLDACPHVDTPARRPDARHVYHLYVVEADDRDALQNDLDARGVSTSVHYPTALPFQPCYADRGHAPEDFPVAHAATRRILSLPMFAELTDDEVDTVAEHVTRFYA